jgi:hypothetical protein
VIRTDTGWLEFSDGYDPALQTYLGLDVGDDPYKCLAVLYHVAQISQGRSEREIASGEVVEVELTPEYANLENRLDSERRAQIPFKAFRDAVEEMWAVAYQQNREHRPSRVYRPDLTPAEGDLVMWETTFKQRHPYRGRLEGIPAQGPD